MWITHRESLITQSALAFLKEKFDDRFNSHVEEEGLVRYIKNGGTFAGSDFKIGLVKADIFQPEGNVVMASTQTIAKRTDLLSPDKFDCIISDECHWGGNLLKRSLDHFSPTLSLGLSATPLRGSDGVLMSDMYDSIAYEYGIGQAVKDGYLSELEGIRIKTNIDLDSVHTLAGEFNQKELSQEVNCEKRNRLVCDSYLKYAKGIQGIFFCVDIAHCISLLEVFLEAGINAKAISSDEKRTPNSQEHIKAYLKGQIDVLLNVDLVSVGFDHPDTGVVGMATPTKSLVKYLQALGRGTRLKSDDFVEKYGQKCIVLDFLDLSSRHSVINTFTLDRGLPTEDKIFLTRREKERLINARNAKIEAKHSKDERIQLLPILTPKWKTNIKSTELINEVEAKYLKNCGYNTDETTYTKENYREIVGSFPATSDQLLELKKFGFSMDAPITRSQASYTLWAYRNNKIKKLQWNR